MMRTIAAFIVALLPMALLSQPQSQEPQQGNLSFLPTSQVIQDLQQKGKASKYFETSMDLVYLDETMVGVINAIQADAITPENLEMIKYVNARDQKPYREEWDHNVYMKYPSGISDIKSLLTDQETFNDLKRRLGREFNTIDAVVYINGPNKIMFILRSPNSQAGSFYRAILSPGSVRIDEISNWRDS